MILFLLTLLAPILIIRSTYLLIWRYKKEKKFFALIHSIIISISGFFSFCILFLLALGSTGHYVASDFEDMMTDWSLGTSITGFLLGIGGLVIAFIMWLKNRKN